MQCGILPSLPRTREKQREACRSKLSCSPEGQYKYVIYMAFKRACYQPAVQLAAQRRALLLLHASAQQ